jgi:hypothetical protein
MKGAVMSGSGSIVFLMIYIGSFLFYLLPFIIAGWRRHTKAGALGFLNIIFGWTILGWIACLVWAFMERGESAYLRRCPRCVENVKDHARVCLFCGNELLTVSVSERICLRCKTRNTTEDTFCVVCSSRLYY